MADNMSVSRSGSQTQEAQPRMNANQQATVAAVQKAVSQGNDDPKLKQDLQAVRNARTPEELHNAMHELRKDAKAAGVAVPSKHVGGAKGAKGAAGDGDLGPDDLNQPGDGLKAAQNQIAGPQFGLNGTSSMFGADTFTKGGR